MKENLLRSMIRKQIKSSLKEAPVRSTVGSTLGRVEKMAGVKMLKKALGQGSPKQQAAGLLAVIQAISGDNPATAKMLARMLMKGGIETPGDVGKPAGAADRFESVNSQNFASNEAVGGALASKGEKLDKTQAMDMLRKTLKTKPASQQAEFVSDLVKSLELKGNVNLLIRKLRKK